MSVLLRDLRDEDLSGYTIKAITTVWQRASDSIDSDHRLLSFIEAAMAQKFVESRNTFFVREEFVLTHGEDIFFLKSPWDHGWFAIICQYGRG